MQGYSIPFGASMADVQQLAAGDAIIDRDPPVPAEIRTGTYMENTELAPKAVGAEAMTWYGWMSAPPQQKGVGRLLIDALIKMPVSSSPTVVRPPLIQRSAYEQINHYRTQMDMNFLSRQMGLRDDSNTRFSPGVVGKDGLPTISMGPRVKTSGQMSGSTLGPVQPSGATSMPPIEHSLFTAAWRIPRFSTTPYTIIPQSSP
jgi:hypothetical protein